jgi:DNA repair protein RadC
VTPPSGVHDLVDDMMAPELADLTAVVGAVAARWLSRMPGGWRRASLHELTELGLSRRSRETVEAMQRLVRQGFPTLPMRRIVRSEDIGAIYSKRLGGLEYEVVIAVALDGRGQVIDEIGVSTGGQHGAAVTPSDVFRPLIRSGASSVILVHNHPSGDPTPSVEDIAMTRALASVGNVVGIALLDHVVVAARAGGWRSICDSNVPIENPNEKTRIAHEAVFP